MAAHAEALFQEDELAAAGLQLGELDDEFYGRGYDPVITRVSPGTGEPDTYFGSGLNS